jgi:cystathionine beta-lyase/cystathionine gamma-synthase
VDIAKTAGIARKHGIMFVVDNTFATPYHQKPLDLGADLVVHSATKGLGGHNDLMAGAIACSKEFYTDLWFTRQAIGTTHDPYSASFLERGLKTLALRARRMSDNAQAMAEYLKKHDKIARIYYPGLADDPGHEVARRQMTNGFGGLLAFDVGETLEEAKKFISNLTTIYHAVSLGATESLICIPFLTTMLYMPPERRTTFGVRENTVRLSAGIVDRDALLSDLEKALSKV